MAKKGSKPSQSYKVHAFDRVPDLWLLDSQYLLDQLATCRELMLRVPLSLATHMPVNVAINAIWVLEEQLRYMLQIQREAQQHFGERHHEEQKTGFSAAEHADARRKGSLGANTGGIGRKAKGAA